MHKSSCFYPHMLVARKGESIQGEIDRFPKPEKYS